MAVEKIYSKALQKWINIHEDIKRATEVELDNVNYAKDDGTNINVSEGFDALESRLNKLEKNIAYLYKNGTLGGGGSGSGIGGGNIGVGGGGDSIQLITETILLNDKNYIYINGQSSSVSYYIKAVSTVAKYYVTVTAGGMVVEGWDGKEMYSLRNAPLASSNNTIKITGIENNTSVVISAVDTNGNELDNLVVYIRPSTYNFTINCYRY